MLREFEPIIGTPVRFPPGRVAIRLSEDHRSAYRRLYARYCTILDGLPVLRDRDFDGRLVKVSRAQLDALNRAFSSLDQPPAAETGTPFEAQEHAKNRLYRKTQYLHRG